jgi:hypothetical protein
MAAPVGWAARVRALLALIAFARVERELVRRAEVALAAGLRVVLRAVVLREVVLRDVVLRAALARAVVLRAPALRAFARGLLGLAEVELAAGICLLLSLPRPPWAWV